MNEWIVRGGWTLIHSSWQISLVGAAFALVIRLAPQRSSVRYRCAMAALIASLALPVLTFFMLSTKLKAASAVSAHSNTGNAMHGMVAIWVLGFAFMLVRVSGGLWLIQKLRRQTDEAPHHLQQILADICQRAGQYKIPKMYLSERALGPCTFGHWRPIILLPLSYVSRLSTTELESILAHELAHIMRKDYLWNLVQSLIECVLFYHPTVWILAKIAREERECCCDEVAANLVGNPLHYARALASLEEIRIRPQTLLGASGANLKVRVQRLLGNERPKPPLLLLLLPVLAIVIPPLSNPSPAHQIRVQSGPTHIAPYVPNRDLTQEFVARKPRPDINPVQPQQDPDEFRELEELTLEIPNLKEPFEQDGTDSPEPTSPKSPEMPTISDIDLDEEQIRADLEQARKDLELAKRELSARDDGLRTGQRELKRARQLLQEVRRSMGSQDDPKQPTPPKVPNPPFQTVRVLILEPSYT